MDVNTYERLTGLKAYTKQQEYERTAEMLPEILENHGDKGIYFLLAFLYDIGYCNKDLKEIMKFLEPN